ncbi:MAG: hypothetical protein ABJO57_13000 [Lentilitoribacter sp.]
MEPATILTALIAGATVALKDTAGQIVKDAYSGLKVLITEKFSVGSITMLEKDPHDESFKQSVEKEIRLTPELLKDVEVQQLIANLYTAIEENVPEEELKYVGIDVKTIRSSRDTIIKGISGFQKGIKSELIDSGQDTIIENISGKPKA